MKLKIRVVRKVFYNNGWGIFACDVVNKEDKNKMEYNTYGNFSIKGNTNMELLPDEYYEVELGDIERSPKGNSYPILNLILPKNTSSNAQYQFLENILTPLQYMEIEKVYPKSKKYKIVDMIKKNEIDLTKVRGIGESTRDKILTSILLNEEKMQVINRLSPLGVSTTMIEKIIQHFDSPQRVILKINESFYNLCQVKGLGFKTVDRYALANGEDKEGFKRIEACITYLIHQEAQEGHSWTDIDEMTKKAVELLEIDEYHIQSYLGTLDMEDGANIVSINDHQITLTHYYEQEKETLYHLQRLDKHYKPIHANKLESYISEAEDYLNITYTDEQRDTVLESFQHGVYIINGKSGAGKSTIIKGITVICDNLGLKYQSVALSGRASQLLINKGISSSTIHRALKYNGSGFMYTGKSYDEDEEDSFLPYDVIILEEASMVNAYLWKSITQAIANGAKLIIVGDSGQLSGIGNGDILRDLLQTQYFKGRELKQIHRQAQDSGIIEIANKIREGENVTGYNWTLNESHGVNNDLFLFTYKEKEELYGKVKEVIQSQMKKLDKTTVMDFQIIVSNKGKATKNEDSVDQFKLNTLYINNYCQSIYNNLIKKYVSNEMYNFRVDDKVIISGNRYDVNVYETINDYQLDEPIWDDEKDEAKEHSLYNGTMGMIVEVDDTKGEESVLVKFEGIDGYVKLNKEQLGDLDLAYAITVHKSQGIGIPNILFLLDFSAFKLMSKQLIYTAITRSSSKCVVMAQNNALHKGITIDASNSRRTFLKQFIEDLKK